MQREAERPIDEPSSTIVSVGSAKTGEDTRKKIRRRKSTKELSFTSRAPRDIEEIGLCVKFLQNTALWKETTLSDSQLIHYLDELLRTGVAILDIFENAQLDSLLKDSEKIVEHPHFEHGFVYVAFACYVQFNVLREIVEREDDRRDPILYFLELYHEFKTGRSARNPLINLLDSGEICEESVSLLSCGAFHDDIANHITLRTSKYWGYRGEFSRRVLDSVRHFTIGFKHDAHLFIAPGEFLVAPSLSLGLKIARANSSNPDKPLASRIYVYYWANSEEMEIRLGVTDSKKKMLERVIEVLSLLHPDMVVDRYEFLRLDERTQRQFDLTEREQKFCFLFTAGYETDQIAMSIYEDENFSVRIRALKSRDVKSLTPDEKLELEGMLRALSADNNATRQIQIQVAIALGIQNKRESFIAALMQNPKLAHEYRKFIFSTYPWPNDLLSRRSY